MDDLLCLTNIGRTSALWLQTVGINNAEQLAEIGAVEAYLRINQRGIKTSKVLLYALHGALLNKHWNDLTTDEKNQLCQQAGINH